MTRFIRLFWYDIMLGVAVYIVSKVFMIIGGKLVHRGRAVFSR